MNKAQTIEVLDCYRELFERLGIKKIDYPYDILLSSQELGLGHCYGMLEKIEGFVHTGRMEKVFRWVGFIQGVLWAQREYTLGELKGHNRFE